MKTTEITNNGSGFSSKTLICCLIEFLILIAIYAFLVYREDLKERRANASKCVHINVIQKKNQLTVSNESINNLLFDLKMVPLNEKSTNDKLIDIETPALKIRNFHVLKGIKLKSGQSKRIFLEAKDDVLDNYYPVLDSVYVETKRGCYVCKK